MQEDKGLIKRVTELEEQVEFLKEVLRKYLLTGQNQLDSAFTEWKKKQGIFRS